MTKTETALNPKTGIQVDIDVNLDTGIVFAVIQQADFQELLTAQTIHDKLKLVGVDHWDIQPGAIDDVLNKVKKAQVGRIIIGSKKDAYVLVSISTDKMRAFASIFPAKGGTALSRDLLLQEISNKSISEKRILENAIESALKATFEVELEIARGKYPIRGKDTEFIQLVSDQEEQSLTPDDKDQIDFLAGRFYLDVTQGTPLLKRIPADPGKIGQDVFGHLIQPESGKDVPFNMPFVGVSLSPDDANVIIADLDGHPVFSPRGVKVDPTLHFKDISLSTGHVEFRGSVEVKGDVNPGMRVIATGDIFVKGTVERAFLKSGANIIIQGGAVGDAEGERAIVKADSKASQKEDIQDSVDDIKMDDDVPSNYECELIAAGDISLKYANVTKLSATNIEAKEYIFNSWTEARRTVLLGQNGGKGKLVGGTTIAGQSIVAKVLGSQAYNKTKLQVGNHSEERLLHKKLKFLHSKRQEQLHSLNQLLLKIPPDKITIANSLEAKKSAKINQAVTELKGILSDIESRITNLESMFDLENEPFITSTKTCFPNVFMSIYNGRSITQLESNANTFIHNGRKVVKKK
ncbi:DUF342 domain-containing protein [Reinekea sp.]|jgi:uncharacterized protein (DUF342 family)|uniref:DUF342 domain-containing protein n=2 Tax=Reinekea sp. TaxID=1970455 RepID=UPI0039895B2C